MLGESEGEGIHIKCLQREEAILGTDWVKFRCEEGFVVSFENEIFAGFQGRARYGGVQWWRGVNWPSRSARLGLVRMRMSVVVVTAVTMNRVRPPRYTPRPIHNSAANASYALKSKHPVFARDGHTGR